MIREQKNKFWLTLILIVSLSFSAFALGVASIFLANGKNIKADAASNAAIMASTDSKVEKWKKNDSTDVNATDGTLSLGTLYGGTTIKVESATDLRSDKAWDSEYKISISHTDTTLKADDGGVYNRTYQPYIQPGYRLTGFYFQANGVNYSNTDADDEDKTLFTAGESATTEQIDPTYTGKITIKAVCERIEYNLSMYYSQDGENWKQQNVTFNIENETDLMSEDIKPDNITSGNSERTFGNWAILKNVVTKTETGFVYVNNIKFASDCEEQLAGDGKIYYYVTDVTGYSDTIENFNDEMFVNGATSVAVSGFKSPNGPEIRATWSYVYNGLISNTSNNADFDQSQIIDLNGDGKIDDEDEKILVGAYSSEDTKDKDKNYKTAELKIAHSESYKYNFMTNNGIAFARLSDFSNNKDVGDKICSVNGKSYYVYNYGSEIIGWKIYFRYGTDTYYLQANDDSWKISKNVPIENTKDALSKTNTSDLASFCETLDAHFISGYDPKTQIIMEPVWEVAKINLKANSETISSNITYGGNYTISDNSLNSDKPGKSIYYYTAKTGDNIIARHSNGGNIAWNYVNIAQDSFSDYNSTDRSYVLSVEPEYVDNIYKVKLTGDVYNTSTRSYNLKQHDATNNQYYFAKANLTGNEYKITSSELNLGYQEYPSGSSVEKYIVDTVSVVENNYKNGIKEGGLSILRKVYTTGATFSNNNLTYTTSNSNEELFIYLANEQKTGWLPVFMRPYFDLIAWDNDDKSTTKYSYITNSYEEQTHKNDFAGRTIKNCNLVQAEYWKFEDLGPQNSGELTLSAHYFRKIYLFDINTFREGTSSEGRFGYVYLEIEDTSLNTTTKIMAIYDNADRSMKYYNVSDITNVNVASIADPKAIALDETSDLLRLQEGVLCVIVYSGSNVTIKASCVDSLTNNDANDLQYQDMIGYYLSSIKSTNNGKDGSGVSCGNLFNEIKHSSFNASQKLSGSYNLATIDPVAIEALNYPSNTKITVDAYFAPIDYTINITLKSADDLGALKKNPFAGRVEFYNLTTSESNAVITFTSNVEDTSKWPRTIKYLANAGYTLSEEAVIVTDIDGNKHILLTYDLTKNTGDAVDAETINSQEYSFSLNGEWLIKYWYTNSYDATILQTIALDVNTELLNFDYQIKIVDDNGNLLTEYVNGTVKLDGNTTSSNFAKILGVSSKNTLATGGLGEYNYISRALVANEFEQINADEDFYVIKVGGKNYVILQSKLSQIMGGNDYSKDYHFILRAENIDASTLEEEKLSQYVFNSIFGFGNIVNSEERVLTMQIKVSELYTITMKAQQHSVLPDGGLTDRTTTIQNHRLGTGNLSNSESLITKGLDFETTKIIYTYKGVNNYISVDYDIRMYQNAIFTLGNGAESIGEIALGETLNEIIFALDDRKVVDGNAILNITYVPKPITVFDVTYVLNGSQVSTVNSSIFADQKPNSMFELYHNQSFVYKYTVSDDYNVSITLNNVAQSPTYNESTNSYSINCIVNESAYNSEGFFLIVYITEVDKRAAVFNYLIEDGTALESDDYGSFDVLVGGNVVELTSTTSGYSVRIPEGRQVQVDISGLAKGYHFVKLSRKSATLTSAITNNVINVVDSFKFTDVNNYNIVIAKDIVQAQLTVNSKDSSLYAMTTPGIPTKLVASGVTTVDAYLGKTLTFSYVETDREKLDYYYYTDSDGEHKIPGDAENPITLEITSELLEKLGNKTVLSSGKLGYVLNIGVKTISKYNLKYSIINDLYAENYAVKLEDGTDYISGSNKLDGTKLLVNVVAKANVYDEDETTITEAKYIIKLSGCQIIDASGKVITDSNNIVEFNDGIADGIIVLDADKTLTITMIQKTYSKTNKEYIYNSLSDYNSLTNAVDATGISAFALDGEMKYGNTVTAVFNRVNKEQGELAVIRLSGNDSRDLVVHIKDKQITSIYEIIDEEDETKNFEYVVDEKYAKHCSGENVKKVTNLVDHLQTYGYSLRFESGVTEKVEIKFVVNNEFSIVTEYKCYKSITIL